MMGLAPGSGTAQAITERPQARELSLSAFEPVESRISLPVDGNKIGVRPNDALNHDHCLLVDIAQRVAGRAQEILRVVLARVFLELAVYPDCTAAVLFVPDTRRQRSA